MPSSLSPFSDSYDRFLDALEYAFEALTAADDLDWERRDDGILMFSIGSHQWVINAHSPREELWLAGPGGAHHFHRDASDVWRDTRSDETFAAVLTEAMHNAGVSVKLKLPSTSGVV